MIINVSDYVERWMNDYIVYHSLHFDKKYGDLDRAINYFNYKYLEQIDTLGDKSKESQMQTIQQQLKKQGIEGQQAINIIDQLQNGRLLEQTMDQIAQQINEGIEKSWENVTFEKLMREAKNFNNALVKGSMDIQRVNDFFRLLVEGINLVGKIDEDILQGLTSIGKTLSGDDSFQLDSAIAKKATKAKVVTDNDVKVAQQVVKALKKASDRFKKNGGTLSSQSFSSTINHIFSTVIGEDFSRILMREGMKNVVGELDNTFTKLGFKFDKNSRQTLGGTRFDVENRVSKVDIFNQKAFNLTITQNGQIFNIELGSNTSVKWYKSMSDASKIHMVNGTPLGSYFKEGTPEKYLAYNVITHRWQGGDFHNAYRVLRASTAASFINEWMTGTGTAIKNSSAGYINKVQFLMVNGKVYSVMRIIRNICNELINLRSDTESKNMPIQMNVKDNRGINTWIGESNRPNIEFAVERSRLVNEVMNKLIISASLNGNVLTQYAY